MIKILLKNELYKIMKKKKIYILMLLIVGVSILHTGLSCKYDDSKNLDWKASAQAQVEYAKEYFEQYADEKQSEDYKEVQKQQTLAQYVLDNNLSSVYIRTYWKAIFDSLDLMIIVAIMAMIICSDIFCEDYSLRTIKLLFTRPNKRSEIWLSKLLSMIVVFFLMSLVLVLTSMLVNMFLYNCSEPRQNIIYLSSAGKIAEKSYFIYFLQTYFAMFVEVTGYILLTAVCSVLFRNASIATTISVVAMLGGNMVISIYEQKIELLKYLLFYNIDLSQYLNGGENYWKTSILFSVVIIILHYLLFFFVGKWVYCKQEIY